MNRKFIILAFIFCFFHASAEDGHKEIDLLDSSQTESLLNRLKNLKDVELSSFASSFLQVEREVVQFLQLNNSQCQGESLVLQKNEQGGEQNARLNLTREQKQRCFREIKNFMNQYIDLSFEIKVHFFKRLKNWELEQLEQSKKEYLKKIESMI